MKRFLFLVGFLFLVLSTSATNKMYRLIVSGQVINKNHDLPIANHKVVIKIFNARDNQPNYSNEVFTDNDGFFCDTIKTSNTKGQVHLFTHDQYQIRYDTVLYFRFFRMKSANLLATFKINMPYNSGLLDVRFVYRQKQGGDKFAYKFFDITDCHNIIERTWDFGDGTCSFEESPEHNYQKTGVFKVRLTIKAKYGNFVKKSSFSKLIFIPDRLFFHIGGQVFAGHFPIDKVKALLYFHDSSDNFIPVDTVKFDTLGYYIFYNIPQGEYIIKAQPDESSEMYGNLFPTYYGDVFRWQDATICFVEQTAWDYDIHLLEGSMMMQGEGAINGNVVITDDRLSYYGIGSGEGITLFLLSKKTESATYLYTGKAGGFAFNDVDLGDYWIYPELTGIHTNKVSVLLDQETPEIEGIIIKLSLSNVEAVFPAGNEIIEAVSVYPNPLTGNNRFVYFATRHEVGGQMNILITSLDGKIVYKEMEKTGSGPVKVAVPVSFLPDGVYLVTITGENGKWLRKKLVINR